MSAANAVPAIVVGVIKGFGVMLRVCALGASNALELQRFSVVWLTRLQRLGGEVTSDVLCDPTDPGLLANPNLVEFDATAI